MPSNVGTIINGSRGSGGGAAPLTFSSSDGTIDIVQVGDNVDLTLDGGPIVVSSPDGTVDVDQVGNAIDLDVVSTPQLIDEEGQTTDAATPLFFDLGVLTANGQSITVNLNITGTSSTGVDIRLQTIVGVVAVRRGGAIVAPTTGSMFVNNGVADGAGAGCVIDPFVVAGNTVRVQINGLAATVINWRIKGFFTIES